MIPSYDMFSPTVRHQLSAYGLSQNYGHQTAYSQYAADNINFNSCGGPAMVESGPANGTYQQNLHNSFSLYAFNNPSHHRQHVVVEDWALPQTTSSPCSYQTQSSGIQFPDNVHPFQVPSPADYSSPGHMRVQEKLEPGLEHPSSDSVVAVSSDGMSGSESPNNLQAGHVQATSGLFRPQPARSPYEWIRRSSCQQTQPNPGRTRTKDKYRVVYSDSQRLELEKEFHYSRYITIRRKVELATSLELSERQIKIWFQNRRAKERRQSKKREELLQKSKDSQIVYQQANLNLANLNIY
ncbi:hypothetical protein JTE90_009991 [Oedothorax gibbosus]|uniref:Homeobox domain-containing protein n=1 Tax=Oedothorax gibbosus TaxID=931172 RepID=A0AAV6UFW7_9ARAC|nr:hypothetical protein JTE90_009991 [Oedothorax gibbosus]